MHDKSLKLLKLTATGGNYGRRHAELLTCDCNDLRGVVKENNGEINGILMQTVVS